MGRIDSDSIVECPKCGKPFQVSEIGGKIPGTKESEEIWCPYNACDGMFTRRSNGCFQSHELTAAEINEYFDRKIKQK